MKYYGTEIDEKYLAECHQAKGECGWDKATFEHVPLNMLFDVMGIRDYHLVTALNVIHELNVQEIARLLVDMLRLCRADGLVIIFDMSELPDTEFDHEFGSLPWETSEMTSIFDVIAESVAFPKSKDVFHALCYESKVTCFAVQLFMRWVDKDLLHDNDSRRELVSSLHMELVRLLKEKDKKVWRKIEDALLSLKAGVDDDNLFPKVNKWIKIWWSIQRMLRVCESETYDDVG